MKKILSILTILILSIACTFGQSVTNIDNALNVFTVMPRVGTSAANSSSLVTSNQAGITKISMSSNIVFSSSSIVSNNMSISNNCIDVIIGRLYISNTNGLGSPVVFSRTAELMIMNTGVEGGGRAIGLYTNMGMVCTMFSNSCPAGATNIYVVDNSAFSANNLLYLMGSNEFVRVAAISSTTNVILKFPTLYGHATTNGVSRVREFGSLTYADSTFSNLLYSTVRFGSNTTVNLKLDIEYK